MIEKLILKLISASTGVGVEARAELGKNLYYSLFDSHLNFGNLLWGCAKNKLLHKVENLQKKCIRNVCLKHFRAHTEPLFKHLDILKFSDKISYCRSIFMHKYRNRKLPISFTGLFTDASDTGFTQNRHTDYNYDTLPATKKYLEKFPLKQIIFNLSLELKATADPLEFEILLKRYYLSKYKFELECLPNCRSCNSN